MTRLGFSAVMLALPLCSPLYAQDANTLNDLKAKIFDAQMAQRNFASGLRIAKAIANPAVITIVGPRVRVEAVEAATTDPVDASGVMTSQTFSTNVYVSDPLVQIVHPAPVHVTVIMEKSSRASGAN